jgi:hypothetical protein
MKSLWDLLKKHHDPQWGQKYMTLDPKEYATLYENHAPCPCPESCNSDQVCIYRCQWLADTPHNREVLASQAAQQSIAPKIA